MSDAFMFYIILQDAVVLSKKDYAGWREIQEAFEKYVTSLGLECRGSY